MKSQLNASLKKLRLSKVSRLFCVKKCPTHHTSSAADRLALIPKTRDEERARIFLF